LSNDSIKIDLTGGGVSKSIIINKSGVINKEATTELQSNTITPSIVTNGLVLHLDAGNINSYPGLNTAQNTWFDLSGNNNNGTLAPAPSTPTYNSANGGALVFDGGDDRVSSSTSNVFNNFSYDIWCLPQTTHEIESQTNSGFGGTSGQKYVIGPQFVASPDAGSGISVGTNGISVYEHSAAYMPPLLSHSVTINAPIHIVVNYTNKVPSLYINGTFIKNGLASTRTNVKITTDLIGAYPSYGFFNGRIYSAKFYSRALTPEEIQQNFNATKGRFGL
jgi:hypothetical protein